MFRAKLSKNVERSLIQVEQLQHHVAPVLCFDLMVFNIGSFINHFASSSLSCEKCRWILLFCVSICFSSAQCIEISEIVAGRPVPSFQCAACFIGGVRTECTGYGYASPSLRIRSTPHLDGRLSSLYPMGFNLSQRNKYVLSSSIGSLPDQCGAIHLSYALASCSQSRHLILYFSTVLKFEDIWIVYFKPKAGNAAISLG